MLDPMLTFLKRLEGEGNIGKYGGMQRDYLHSIARRLTLG